MYCLIRSNCKKRFYRHLTIASKSTCSSTRASEISAACWKCTLSTKQLGKRLTTQHWKMSVFQHLLLLAHVRNSPSAVPCTKRYLTEWKFLALSVTVEVCTQFVFRVAEIGFTDTKDKRFLYRCKTYAVGERVLCRLHHVALCVDAICNKRPHNYRPITLDLETLKMVEITIIDPFRDGCDCHSTLEDSASRP